jgi:transposase-like protein
MTKAEQVRLTAWRLRVLQQAADDGNVARVCRRFGISRKSFYKWKRRRRAWRRGLVRPGEDATFFAACDGA